jgi:hypothetical protein
MHDTRVKMKDGRDLCAPIWYWRPLEGYMTLVGEPDERLYFRDMESAVTKDVLLNVHTIGLRDELERARQDGWDGVR